MTLGQLLKSGPIRKLALDHWPADRVVGYYEDGLEIDDAISMLRRLTDCNDGAMSGDAEDLLRDLLAARERYHD